MSKINETLKKAIDDIDLDKRLNEAVEQAESGFHAAVTALGSLAHEHRDDYERVMDRLAGALHERTDGRYDDQVGRVRERLDTGMDRLAERRDPEEPEQPGA